MHVKNKKEIVESKKELPKKGGHGGVYFLIQKEDIVYVGKSEDYINRILNHIIERKKQFDSYSVIEINDDLERSITEAFYITAFEPKYNDMKQIQKEHLQKSLNELSSHFNIDK
jgi:excinuclease UvrABC nuclease subunit